MITSAQLIDALTRAEQLLFATPAIESFIARHEAGHLHAAESAAATVLTGPLIAAQAADGSWGASLLHTAEDTLLLHALRASEADAPVAIARAAGWLRSRQGAPGSYVDRCTPDLHGASLCHHFAAGFFSPGPRSESFAGTCLSGGVHFESDDDARLALSALGLRALLVTGPAARDDLLQIDALCRLAEHFFTPESRAGNAAALNVLAALTHAPRTDRIADVAHKALLRLTGQQRGDGSWVDSDPFHVGEVLLMAHAAGFDTAAVAAAIERTASLLVLTQQPNGSWSNDVVPLQLLTSWRVLRHVAEAV